MDEAFEHLLALFSLAEVTESSEIGVAAGLDIERVIPGECLRVHSPEPLMARQPRLTPANRSAPPGCGLIGVAALLAEVCHPEHFPDPLGMHGEHPALLRLLLAPGTHRRRQQGLELLILDGVGKGAPKKSAETRRVSKMHCVKGRHRVKRGITRATFTNEMQQSLSALRRESLQAKHLHPRVARKMPIELTQKRERLGFVARGDGHLGNCRELDRTRRISLEISPLNE